MSFLTGRPVFFYGLQQMRKRRYTALEQGPGLPELAEGVPLPVVHNIVATSQIQSSVKSLDLARIRTLLPFSFYDKVTRPHPCLPSLPGLTLACHSSSPVSA